MNSTDEYNLMIEISNCTDTKKLSKPFNLLYKSISPPLYGQLRKNYIPPLKEDDIQDIMQDGWRKVLEKRDSFQEGNNVYNWIYTICKNYAINLLKRIDNDEKKFGKKSNSIVKHNESEVEFEISDNDLSIDEKLYEKDMVYMILKVIDNLDDKNDIILAKDRLINRLSFEEISRITGKSTSTLHYRMNVILKAIKSELKGLI